MKIGKVDVKKLKDKKLGEVLEISVDGDVTACFEVSEQGKLRLVLSKETAKQLALYIIQNKSDYLRTFDADV